MLRNVIPDPKEVKVIAELPQPTNSHALKRGLGMVNYMGKYIAYLATVGGPLHELLKTNVALMWGWQQQ